MILWRWLLIAPFLLISLQAISNDYDDSYDQEEAYAPEEEGYYPQEEYTPEEPEEYYSDEY